MFVPSSAIKAWICAGLIRGFFFVDGRSARTRWFCGVLDCADGFKNFPVGRLGGFARSPQNVVCAGKLDKNISDDLPVMEKGVFLLQSMR